MAAHRVILSQVSGRAGDAPVPRRLPCRNPESPAQVAHLVRTAWIHGQAKAKVQIVHQWYSPYTNPNHFHDFDEADASLIVALRNAAPDLIAVVRAAAKLRHHDEGSGVCGTYYRPPRACDCKNGELIEALAKLGVGS